jgi:hypothetical protein
LKRVYAGLLGLTSFGLVVDVPDFGAWHRRASMLLAVDQR